MLRKLRIILAALFLTGITLLFIGIGQQWWGWMAKIQFLPSCLALNFMVTGGILLLTLLFGRIYCSVICPLGVFQDLALAIRQRIGKKSRKVHKFSFTPERKWLRYGMLALFIAALVAGMQVFVALIAPYSAYGRIVSSVVGIGRDGTPAALLIVGLVTLVVMVALAATLGRAWCNNICPVGTVLGLVSRFSLFRPTIDKDKCVHCHSCGKKCKASCIDSGNMSIDGSRCVDCFDCIENCKVGAIRYRVSAVSTPSVPLSGGRFEPASGPHDAADIAPAAHATLGNVRGGTACGGVGEADGSRGNIRSDMDEGRRNFIVTAAALTSAAAVGSAIPAAAKAAAEGSGSRLVPFGAQGWKHFYDRCTACQLCVGNCPNHVLRPSTDLAHLMQPEMVFDRGYCRPECVKCSQTCPAGAILPITKDEKKSIHIGTARVDLDLCVVNTDEVNCGNCARHCPVGAIRMVKDEKTGRKVPAVFEMRCIGCGACEHLCPAKPVKAIRIEGLETHRQDNW